MSQFRATPATFKLVGEHDPARLRNWNDTRRDVARENVSAAQINPRLNDPRWTLAKLAYAQLKEGPITPEQRDGLVSKAGGLGLRPFDASLIIAIAQDHTRTGRSLGEAEKTLRLVRPPHANVDHVAPTQRWAVAALLAALLGTAIFSLL
jgi:hypothetical protein